jgi:HPt (histidine-containing phosphotransfer) domain-containing protein
VDVPQLSHDIISDLLEDPAVAILLDEFIAELRMQIHDLQHAADHADWSKVAGISHALIGSAGYYGFPTISQAAHELESAARTLVDGTQIRKRLASLLELCRRAVGTS